MKLSPAQIRAFQKSATQCQQLRERLELYERLALIEPTLKARAEELRQMYDHQETLCTAALAMAAGQA